ncbi:MAG TPA: hypothetical protein VF768_09100, partial [Holophagaceae bacterium]
MSLRSWILGAVALGVLGATVAGYVVTSGNDPAANFRNPIVRRPAKPAKKAKGGKEAKGAKTPKAQPSAKGAVASEPVVDEGPLRAAHALAGLAATPEEAELAQQANRLANHEVDLAFADAIREAADRAPAPTPELQALMDEKDAAEDAVTASQRQMARLTQALATATGDRKDALADQLEVAKAQLELDQDELQDASDNLEQAGGDPQAKVRRLRAAHDAVQNEAASVPVPAGRFSAGSLVGRIQEWAAQQKKLARLEQALQAEQQKVQELRQKRDAMALEVERQRNDRQATRSWASGFVKGRTEDATRAEAKAAVTTLQHFMGAQRTLASLGKRLQDEEDLVTVYDSWAGLALAYRQLALHRILGSLLVILGVWLAAVLAGRLAGPRARETASPGRRTGTLGSVVSLGAAVLAVLVSLFVALGVPAQATTVLGLAGAGLTVALKDFIVAFFGWFVLMGRNGIHVGDWVEIK